MITKVGDKVIIDPRLSTDTWDVIYGMLQYAGMVATVTLVHEVTYPQDPEVFETYRLDIDNGIYYWHNTCLAKPVITPDKFYESVMGVLADA